MYPLKLDVLALICRRHELEPFRDAFLARRVDEVVAARRRLRVQVEAHIEPGEICHRKKLIPVADSSFHVLPGRRVEPPFAVRMDRSIVRDERAERPQLWISGLR